MTSQELPHQFSELKPFVDWALPTELERSAKRCASEMSDIQAFYGAMFPQMEAIIEYLNGYPLNGMPLPEQRLLYMTLSLAEIANAVELFKESGVPDGFAPERFIGT